MANGSMKEEEEACSSSVGDRSHSSSTFKGLPSVHRAVREEKKSRGPDDAAKTTCCGLFKTKDKGPPPFEQAIVVLRHSIRLDHKDPKGYMESEMGKSYPWDGPITAEGRELAETVAKELLILHREVNFSAIAVSPFLRCLETAMPVASLLQLPIMMDEELGEIWERAMPSTHMPHRPPSELKTLAVELGFRVLNPLEENGGIKLFGKLPASHPENLEDGHKRYLVRLENYIRLSAHSKQNFIIVGHAGCVAAMLNIFERGFADIEKTDYCARVIARRRVKESAQENEHGVYADHWDVDSKAVHVCKSPPLDYQKKLFENMHIEFCQETKEMVAKRSERRTKTDKLFDDTIKAMAKIEVPDDDGRA